VVGPVHGAPQVEDDEAQDGADDQRDPPGPRGERLLGEELLQHDQHGQGQQLADDDRDVLEAGVEAAPARGRDLGQVGGAGAELATGEVLDWRFSVLV
jgi:hypothetical protein